MTKYIRTKTKIEEIETALSNKELFDYLKQFDNYKDDLIMVADTIEELCDEFVWKWNEKEFPYSTARQYNRYSGYGDLKRAIRQEENYGKYINHEYQIYGAVWRDEGLIYVAKINDKGELELL